MSRRRPALVLLLWAACLALAIGQLLRTSFVADLSAFLPTHPGASQRALMDQIASGVASRTLLVGLQGADAPARARASVQMADALRRSGLFAQVQNGERTGWRESGDWLFRHRYLLSPGTGAGAFDVDGLRDAIGDTLSRLGTPAGSLVKPILDHDPTGETLRLAESLAPARAPRVEEGVWMSRSSPRAVLLLVTRAEGSDLDAQARAIRAVHDAVPKAAGLELQISGAPWFAVDSRARIEREATTLALVGTVAMVLLLGLAFGSPRAIGLALLPVASGALAGVAATGLVFTGVHGLTLAFGSTLIGESVDYAIYYLIQARGGWQAWRTASWPTVRLGLWTSVCGFAALVVSGFPGLAQLGVFSIAGLLAAAATTRWVLPVLAPHGAAGRGLRDAMARATRRLIEGLARWRTAFLLLGAVAAALVAWRGEAAWNAGLSDLNPIPASAQALDAALRDDLGGGDARVLVVAQGADAQAALRAAEAAGSRLDALVDRGLIAGYDSPARWLPSVALQRERQARLPEAAALQSRLQAATAGGPLAPQRLQPFVDDVQAARAQVPLEPASLAGTALEPIVQALLVRSGAQGWMALLPLQAPQPQGDIDAAALRSALQGLQGVQVLDLKRELDALYTGYRDEALRHAGLGALGVLVLLAVHLRSPRRWAAVVLPLALAVLLTLAGLVLLDVRLGVLHLVGLLLVVAVGSNYALFFDQLQQDARADPDTLASLLLANVTTVLSFGLIAVSDIPALSALGRVVAPGACLALWLAAACAPQASRT